MKGRAAFGAFLRFRRHPRRYHVLVKVIDIFGNDTSQGYDVKV